MSSAPAVQGRRRVWCSLWIAGLIASASAGEAASSEPDAWGHQQVATRAVAAEAIRSVVAIEQAIAVPEGPAHYQACGSGVIITPAGLILSQYHVSHMLDPSASDKHREPGERVRVVLADGQSRQAELLGADLSFDLSLLRLIEEGPYPCAPLDAQCEVALGDWVLKVGHPLGYRAGRPPVVRIGRVLCRQDDTFATDCHLSGGDSGGPLFDLQGHLVGIVRGGLNHPLRPSARSGMLFGCTTNRVLISRLESMQRGEFSGPDQQLVRDTTTRFQRAPTLPSPQWAQGAELRSSLRDRVGPQRPCVVAIKESDETVALGTIVDSEGWIITKASQLVGEPVCWVEGRAPLPARIAKIDPAYDLALLKVDAVDLPVVRWRHAAEGAALGTIVVAPGTQPDPIAWGIVSVARRDLEGPFPTTVTPAPRVPVEPATHELTGVGTEGGFLVQSVAGGLASAGILPGDVLRTLAGEPVRSGQDVASCLSRHLRRDPVPLVVQRAGGRAESTIVLSGQRPFRYSARRDDFPTVFEHDAPLTGEECGGPILDLDGQALGITIASVGAQGCMAIPSERVEAVISQMRASARDPAGIRP